MSKDRVSIDSTKVGTVTKWECPTMVTSVQSFLGLAGYYQRFMPNFDTVIEKRGTIYME